MSEMTQKCPFTGDVCRFDCQLFTIDPDNEGVDTCVFCFLGDNIKRIADTLDRIATTQESRRMEGN